MVKVVSIMIKRRFFSSISLILCCFSLASSLYAMRGDERDRGVFASDIFRWGGSMPRGIQDLMAADNINRLIEKTERELGEIRELEDNSPGKADKIQTHERMVLALRKQLEKLLGIQGNAEKYGLLMARGIGGKTWDSFGFQQDVEGFSDGIKKGLTVRVTEAFGDAVASKVKSTIDLILGGTWDFLLLRTLDLWDDVCSIFFHSSCEGFKLQEIEGWQKLMIESMKQIEKNVKEGPKDNFRGQDMTLRNFGSDNQETNNVENNVIILNAWKMYILGCIEQFDYLIELIGKRKKYYSEEKLIFFYAEQIQKRLSDYRDLMLKAQTSVKDFDELIESNRSLLPAMRENIDILFKRLLEEAKPRTVPSGNSDSFRRTTTEVSRQRSDDDMPNRFGNSWGS